MKKIGKLVFTKQNKNNTPNMDLLYNTGNQYYVYISGHYLLCEIAWYQGRSNNYKFEVESYGITISPDDVELIFEVLE